MPWYVYWQSCLEIANYWPFQAGNEKHDLKRAEQDAKERAKAHIKFEQLSRKRKAAEGESASSESSEFAVNMQDKSPMGEPDERFIRPRDRERRRRRR
jgi:exosome complex protein LRP1